MGSKTAGGINPQLQQQQMGDVQPFPMPPMQQINQPAFPIPQQQMPQFPIPQQQMPYGANPIVADALRLAQPMGQMTPTSRRGDSNPFLKTGVYASPKPIFNDPNNVPFQADLGRPDLPPKPPIPSADDIPFQADLGRPDSMPFPPGYSDPLPFPPGYKEAGGMFVPYEVSGRRSERMPTLDMGKVTPRPPGLGYDPRPIPPKPPINPKLPAGYGYDPRGKRSSADTFTGGGKPPAQMGDVSYYGNSVLPPGLDYSKMPPSVRSMFEPRTPAKPTMPLPKPRLPMR